MLITLRTRLAFCVFLGLPLFLFTVGASKAADIVKVTRDGRETTLSQKLITVKANTPVWQDAAGSGKAEYVGAFNIFFHAKSDDGKIESLGKYRIADEKGKPLGWVKVEDVQPWGTRFAITPNVPNGQNKFEVQLDAGGQAIYDPEDIPSTAAAYSFITGPSKGTGSNAEDDGPFPVCFCIAESGSSGATAEANQIANMQLEIVFVIENADFLLAEFGEKQLIEDVKKLAREFAELAQKDVGSRVPTRFGLVTFQDTNERARDKRPVVVQPLTNQISEWRSKMLALNPVAIGADWPEDGLSGVDAALSSSMGWSENSSKHIVVMGYGAFQTENRGEGGKPFSHFMAWRDDRGSDIWKDLGWDKYFGYNSSGQSIGDIHERAFPRGGATGTNLRQSYHLHAIRIGETQEQFSKRIYGEELHADLMEMNAKVRKALKDSSDDEIIGAWLEGDSPLNKDTTLTFRDVLNSIWNYDRADHYDNLAANQFRQLANGGDVQGYFASVEPTDSAVSKAVDDLQARVSAAIAVIGDVAAGKIDDVMKDSQASPGTEFSKPIFRIVNSSMKDGEIIEKPVQTGVAVVRSEATGRLVGNKVIMVSQNELTRLASAFNSLYEQFDRRRSRAERQDVSGVLDELKTSLAVASAGQKIDSGTQLSQLITDLPLRTTALSMTANDIAVMGTQDFEAWLEEIKLAEQRTRLLLNDDAGRWISISSLGNAKDRYAFPKVADLP